MKPDEKTQDSLKKLRKRAEQSVRKTIEHINSAPLSGDEARRLIHELHVRQVELEIQNEELHRAQGETEESRNRYAALYDFAPVGYLTLDRKGIIRQVNLTGAMLLGLERKFLVNTPFVLFVAIESRNAFHRHLQHTFDTRTAQTTEIELKRRDGGKFHARLESSLQREGSDGSPECQSIVSDITDRVNAERALRALNRDLQTRVEERTAEIHEANAQLALLVNELEAKNEELEKFSYTVSHDLNAPLITIQSFVSAIMKDLAAGNVEQSMKDLQRVHAAAGTMSALLHGLRQLSRVGKILNSLEPTPFKEVVEQALGSLQGPILQSGAQVEVAEDFPTVVIDKMRMVQVLQNLVENAIKFSRAEEPPHIEIGSFQDKGENVFYVKDHGEGIDSLYQEQVFEMFRQLDPSVAGIGLGLALVKKIIEHHGGQVRVGVNHGEPGITFLFSLPQGRAT